MATFFATTFMDQKHSGNINSRMATSVFRVSLFKPMSSSRQCLHYGSEEGQGNLSLRVIQCVICLVNWKTFVKMEVYDTNYPQAKVVI